MLHWNTCEKNHASMRTRDKQTTLRTLRSKSIKKFRIWSSSIWYEKLLYLPSSKFDGRESVAKIVNRFRMPLSGDVPELGSKIKTFLMNSNIILSMFYLLLCETYILFSWMKLKKYYRYLINHYEKETTSGKIQIVFSNLLYSAS